MTDLITLRGSSMPMAFKCAASVRSAEVPIDETNEAAAIGTATHEALRVLAETGGLDWDAMPAIAARHGVPVDEVRMLCAIAFKLWPELRESFQGAVTEVELSGDVGGVTLTGHVDLLKVRGTVARAGDWKTGRKDADYSHQMKAYGTLILMDDQTLTEVTITVIWVREGEIENYTMTREDARRWRAELRERVLDWDGVYRTGPHCTYCRRAHECVARTAMVRANVEALTGLQLDLTSMEPDQIVALLRQADSVRLVAESLRSAVKEHVLATGDIVADGTRITIDTEQRRELDAALAWPVLEAAGFNDEDFAASMDLRISRVEKQIVKKHARGFGAANVRKVKAELEAAGAVQTKEIQKLAIKRA